MNNEYEDFNKQKNLKYNAPDSDLNRKTKSLLKTIEIHPTLDYEQKDKTSHQS